MVIQGVDIEANLLSMSTKTPRHQSTVNCSFNKQEYWGESIVAVCHHFQLSLITMDTYVKKC